MVDHLPAPAGPAAHAVFLAFDAAFPGRMRAAYVEGSYADGSARATSDLDLVLVFADGFTSPAERDAARSLAVSCSQNATMELDISVEDERTLARGVTPALKLASAHVFGADIRDTLPLIPIAEWARDRMHTSWWRVARLFKRPTVITPPLEYPEPDAPFLGYTRRTVRLADGQEAPSTRDLIRLTGWAATALLALDHGLYTPSKRALPGLYREYAGEPWAGFISEVDQLCRARWSYLIPKDAGERAQLRALCERTLLFERYFLTRYNPYLIAELQAGGDRAVEACEVMRRAPLADEAVTRELRRLARSAKHDERAAARMALAAYAPA